MVSICCITIILVEKSHISFSCSVRFATKSFHLCEGVWYSYALRYLGRRVFASMPMKKSSLVRNELPTREILGHEVRYIVVCVHMYNLNCAVLDKLTDGVGRLLPTVVYYHDDSVIEVGITTNLHCRTHREILC
jgi:hypothetical protein